MTSNHARCQAIQQISIAAEDGQSFTYNDPALGGHETGPRTGSRRVIGWLVEPLVKVHHSVDEVWHRALHNYGAPDFALTSTSNLVSPTMG
jgi:hypothetical protein